MNIYYVYAYLRKSDNTPYYIGKGKGSRIVDRHPGISIPKDPTKVVFIEQHLTNIGACAIERRLIRWYGRKDLNTGILLNRTSGGDGGKGGSRKGRVLSIRCRQKLSEAGKKRVQTNECKQKIRDTKLGKNRPPFSKEWRVNLSKSRCGLVRGPRTESFKERLSAKTSHPIYCITNDTIYPSRRIAANLLNLTMCGIGHCLQGYQKSTKGFKFSWHRKYDFQF